MAALCTDLALKAAKENLSHEAYLFELAKHEKEQRNARRTARLLRQAGLLAGKTFATFEVRQLTPALQLQLEQFKSGAFLETATNVIAVGKPGVGKSHALAAVAHELILAGHPVLWSSTAALVQRLLAAKRDLHLPQELAKFDKFACVILDDIGYVQHDRDEMEVLFTFLAERYERKSVMITTNLVFSEWKHIFKNPMTTLAALDRVLWRVVIRVDDRQYVGTAEAKLDAPKNTPDGTNPFECAETSALGRALAFAGFGSVERIASYNEVARSRAGSLTS